MADIMIIINGSEHACGYELARALAENLPESKAYDAIAEDLLALGIPSITERLAEREGLGMSALDAIWESGDIDIRRKLARNESFRLSMTDRQAQDIMDDDDISTLISLAMDARDLYPDPDCGCTTRLSIEAANRLMEHMITHRDPLVWQALADHVFAIRHFPPAVQARIRTLPGKCLSRFSGEHSGLRAHLSLDTMYYDDIMRMDKAPRCALEYIAQNIEDIRDRRVRSITAKKLAGHADPLIRLTLAQNPRVHRLILEDLACDSEPDVAAAAAETIAELKDSRFARRGRCDDIEG